MSENRSTKGYLPFLLYGLLAVGLGWGIALAARSSKSDSPQARRSAPPPPETIATFDPGAATARLRGTVRFEGTPPLPQPPTLSVDGDPCCTSAHPTPPANPSIRIDSRGGVAGVFVHVDEPSLEKFAYVEAKSREVVIDQVGCLYRPHVSGIYHGQPLRILNSDDTSHNVHFVSEATGQEWNLDQPSHHPLAIAPGATTYPERAQLGATLRCDKHPWMRAILCIQYHPFFAVSGEDGRFELPPLPPGTYRVIAWHERLGTLERTITIRDGESDLLEFIYLPE